jgi:hypothetical protein
MACAVRTINKTEHCRMHDDNALPLSRKHWITFSRKNLALAIRPWNRWMLDSSSRDSSHTSGKCYFARKIFDGQRWCFRFQLIVGLTKYLSFPSLEVQREIVLRTAR